jgi:hypothetical protein
LNLKPNLNLELKTYKKEIEKELEKPEKKKKGKAAQQPSSAQPGRAPTPPDRLALPVSGCFLSRTLSLSLSLSLSPSARWGQPVGTSCFARARPSSLSVSWARAARR